MYTSMQHVLFNNIICQYSFFVNKLNFAKIFYLCNNYLSLISYRHEIQMQVKDKQSIPNCITEEQGRKSLQIGSNMGIVRNEYLQSQNEIKTEIKDDENYNQNNQKKSQEKLANAQQQKTAKNKNNENQMTIQRQQPQKKSMCGQCANCVCSVLVIIFFIIFLPFFCLLFCCCCICGICCGKTMVGDEGDFQMPEPTPANQQDIRLTEGYCTVCRQSIKIGSGITRLNCQQNHIFHSTCVQVWSMYKLSCPRCSKPLQCRHKQQNIPPVKPQFD